MLTPEHKILKHSTLKFCMSGRIFLWQRSLFTFKFLSGRIILKKWAIFASEFVFLEETFSGYEHIYVIVSCFKKNNPEWMDMFTSKVCLSVIEILLKILTFFASTLIFEKEKLSKKWIYLHSWHVYVEICNNASFHTRKHEMLKWPC